jgi:hypothetical protein
MQPQQKYFRAGYPDVNPGQRPADNNESRRKILENDRNRQAGFRLPFGGNKKQSATARVSDSTLSPRL